MMTVRFILWCHGNSPQLVKKKNKKKTEIASCMGTNIYAKYLVSVKSFHLWPSLKHWAASLTKKCRSDPSAVHHSYGHWALLKKKGCGGICLLCQQLPRLCLISHLYCWGRFQCDAHIFRFSLTTECNKGISPIPHIQVSKLQGKKQTRKTQLLQ